MAKDYAKPFYDSKAWQDCREAYIAKTLDGLCEQCLKHNKITPGYIVDHIKEITPNNINNAEITLNHDNLQYLCLDCHNKKTFGKSNVRDGYMFDSEGQLVESGMPPIKICDN